MQDWWHHLAYIILFINARDIRFDLKNTKIFPKSFPYFGFEEGRKRAKNDDNKYLEDLEELWKKDMDLTTKKEDWT